MGGLFGGGGSMPSAPRKSDSDVQAEALKERRRQALAQGRSSTILGGSTSQDTKLQTSTLGSQRKLGG